MSWEKGERLQEVLGKNKVRKSKEDELCPGEEAISAGEEAVKEVVDEARPCLLVDSPSSFLETISKTCLETKETKTWRQLKAYAQRKRDSAKPEAEDRAKEGQTHLPWQKNSAMGPVPEMPRSKSKRQTLEGSQHDEMKEKWTIRGYRRLQKGNIFRNVCH